MDGLVDAIAMICLFVVAVVVMRRVNSAEPWDWARLLRGEVGQHRDPE